MRRSHTLCEAEVDRLRNELFVARMAIIGMAPREFQDFLSGFFSCKSRKEAYEWHHKTVQKIVERVQPKLATEMGDVEYNGPRAYCPLCGSSSDNIFQVRGFAYPEGLTRHLKGSFNARHCDVMKAALGLACEAAEEASQGAPTIGLSETPRKRGAPHAKR